MGFKMSEVRNNSLYDRVNKLLVSVEWSDCSFSVCGKKFKAHKLILGISSPVFEAMFYGPMSNTSDIVITDIEPEVFQCVLNYIYTDKIEITSIEEAFELLYASRKYILEHLTEVCIKYVQANLSIDNLITILNYSDYMHDKQLLISSLKLFCEHASYLLPGNINNISLSCLKNVLMSNDINISEKDLIKYVFKWTIYYCEQNNIMMNFKNRREVLIKHGIFKLLRFFTLTVADVDDILLNTNNLLMPHESDNIKHVIKKGSNLNYNTCIDSLSPITIARNPLKLQWQFCHRSPLRSASPVCIETHNNFIYCRLKANKSIFINFLRIPSQMAPDINFCKNTPLMYNEQISICIISESNNSITTQINFSNNVEYDSNIDIEFPEPCFLQKDKWYKICFNWPRNGTFHSFLYALQCREILYNNYKVNLEFEDVFSTSDTYGSFLKGLKFCL